MSGEGAERRQRAAGPGGMDENGVEAFGRGGSGLEGLIDRQGAGLDAAAQQGGEVAGRFPGTGNQQGADSGSLRDEPGGKAVQIAFRGLHFRKARRTRRLRRGVADGEDRTAAVRRQGGEGRDAVGAGEGEGGDAGQVGRGLRDRADRQKGGDDGLEAESGQAVGGARGARLGARDPDAADRRQGSTCWSPAAAWTSAPSRRPRARACSMTSPADRSPSSPARRQRAEPSGASISVVRRRRPSAIIA